jgi:iron-sulfur cluster repair protein YtfE (RIC family)
MKRAKRRRESIIPLSREHQYALLLCLRIHRGVEKHRKDLNWLHEQTRKTIQFFDSNLAAHFQTEEAVLFPAMANLTDAAALILTLCEEHEEIKRRIEHLRGIEWPSENKTLANALNSFADLLEAHIRKEERQLFPIFEKEVTTEVDRKVGQEILSRIGPALQPKNPELLE